MSADVRNSLLWSHNLGRKIWTILNERWGDLGIGTNFQIHLQTKDKSASVGGLEHADATVMSFGIDSSADDAKYNFVETLAHEAIHAWNVKRIYPTELATTDYLNFNDARLNQIYFYEGFTEAFARIILLEAENDPKLVEFIRNLWAGSIFRIKNYFVGKAKTPDQFIHEAMGGGYDWGAFMALTLASDVRKNHGLEAGKEKLWTILKALRDARKPSFSLQKALPDQLVFYNSVATIRDANPGYAASDLEATLKNTLSLPHWNDDTNIFFSKNPVFNTAQELTDWCERIAIGSETKLQEMSVQGMTIQYFARQEGHISWPL